MLEIGLAGYTGLVVVSLVDGVWWTCLGGVDCCLSCAANVEEFASVGVEGFNCVI